MIVTQRGSAIIMGVFNISQNKQVAVVYFMKLAAVMKHTMYSRLSGHQVNISKICIMSEWSSAC